MVEIRSFDPETLVLIALLNPAVVAVAVVMGWQADQWQKTIVAAFAASLAGFVLYWLAAAIGLLPIHALGGEAALVVLQFTLGLLWAALSYSLRRRSRT
jgi:hypothetical protein